MLAKTYLAAAWDLDKKEYFSKASQVADDVIAGRSLVTPLRIYGKQIIVEMIMKSLSGMWNMIMRQQPILLVAVTHGVLSIAIILVGKKIMEREVRLLL